MTETDDTAKLVAALDSGCNDGTDLPGVLNRAARKIEAQAARIAELKAERDALAAVIGVPSDILADVKADVIREAADAIRAHATAPTELIYPHVQIDPLIAWVADWMENPPEWVKVSYRKKAGE